MGFRVSTAVLVLMSCFSLLACDTLDFKRPVSEDKQKGIDRIGVVSLLGERFQGVYIGTTVFNNQRYEAMVPSWNIDADSAQRALETINGAGLFRAGLLDRAGTDNAALVADKGRRIWELARQQGFDTIVALEASSPANRLDIPGGFGMFIHSIFGLGHSPCVFSAFVVSVYRVATQSRIAWEWGGQTPCGPKIHTDLDFRPSLESYTSEEQSEIRARIEAGTDVGIRYALGGLDLIPRPPNQTFSASGSAVPGH